MTRRAARADKVGRHDGLAMSRLQRVQSAEPHRDQGRREEKPGAEALGGDKFCKPAARSLLLIGVQLNRRRYRLCRDDWRDWCGESVRHWFRGVVRRRGCSQRHTGRMWHGFYRCERNRKRRQGRFERGFEVLRRTAQEIRRIILKAGAAVRRRNRTLKQ